MHGLSVSTMLMDGELKPPRNDLDELNVKVLDLEDLGKVYKATERQYYNFSLTGTDIDLGDDLMRSGRALGENLDLLVRRPEGTVTFDIGYATEDYIVILLYHADEFLQSLEIFGTVFLVTAESFNPSGIDSIHTSTAHITGTNSPR